MRISNIVRNVDWIKTEYNNQNSLGTFYSYSVSEVNNIIYDIKIRGGGSGASIKARVGGGSSIQFR
jgi:hypothetical protein